MIFNFVVMTNRTTHHFTGFAPVRSDWAIQKYTDATKRLYSVL